MVPVGFSSSPGSYCLVLRLISKLGRSRLACRLVSCVSPGVSFLFSGSSRRHAVSLRARAFFVSSAHPSVPCSFFFHRLVIMRPSPWSSILTRPQGRSKQGGSGGLFSFSLIDVLGRSRSVISSSAPPRRRFMPRSRPGHRLARLIVSSPRFLTPVMMRKARGGNAGGAKHLAIADDRMSDRTGRRGVEDKQATRTTRRPTRRNRTRRRTRRQRTTG